MKIDIKRSFTFYEQMATRRSIREFTNEPVDESVLLNAIKTAATAPSGANKQPWHFALVQNPEIKKKIRTAAEAVESDFYQRRAPRQWLEDLKPFATDANKAYLTEASSLVIVFTRTHTKDEQGRMQKTYYPLESTGIAVGLLIASLHQSGLATLTHTPKPMGFLNELLGFDKTYKPYMIIVAGHAKLPTQLPEIKKKETRQIMSLH
tara:strand:+ start:180 stop:800 length:621 start_codon:yes stop_codon:yes gene_type:complete